MELEGWTNDRLVEERLARLPRDHWVHGSPNAARRYQGEAFRAYLTKRTADNEAVAWTISQETHRYPANIAGSVEFSGR
jgi:hypothetical protein